MHGSWYGLLVIVHKQCLRASTGYWSLSTNSAWELVRVTGHSPQTVLESWCGLLVIVLKQCLRAGAGCWSLSTNSAWELVRVTGESLNIVSDNAWQLLLVLCKDTVLAGWCVLLVVDACLFLPVASELLYNFGWFTHWQCIDSWRLLCGLVWLLAPLTDGT